MFTFILSVCVCAFVCKCVWVVYQTGAGRGCCKQAKNHNKQQGGLGEREMEFNTYFRIKYLA